MGEYENIKRGEKGAWVSIIAYLVLAAVKLIVATIGNSEALRADGLNNTTDVIASIAVLIGLKISRKPPDEDHHYGHFRAETIASLVAAFIMMTVGIEVIVGTIGDIMNGHISEPSMLTGWTAILAALFMFVVYRYNLNLAGQVGSQALYAAAQDNRSDALVSIGAAVGIFGAQLGVYWLDPLAGLIVGLIICKTAWDIFREASHTLSDGFNKVEVKNIRHVIASHPSVLTVEDVKARLQGNQTFVDATIHIDPNLTIQEGHDITDEVEVLLKQEMNIYYAHIHIEPFKEE
ncbi:cation diffusion facilitator family transporter [Halobacillus naozhouensis]|uniref:Cation diffusion facilitator family transporter n=1 Tax=Halobacillus naozhouensis TaxID=554880 RepID=A0ABY8J381_9BACI|nr:cation diffusion facilitator family transporter [Halobacillus naozhouensis]WFT76039.1 cation diffusion facilitator family transporter [Halobacillus naozhouensis]